MVVRREAAEALKAAAQRVRFPSSRIGTIDLGRLGARKHHVAALLEVDVTAARGDLRKQQVAGKAVSFFAWAVRTICLVVSQNAYVQALRGPGRTTVVFRDVDVSVTVERAVQGTRVPLVLVVRRANEKTVEEIYAELQRARGQAVHDEKDYVLGDSGPGRWVMKAFYGLPQWLRLLLLSTLLRSPQRSKTTMGTVIITSVGTPRAVAGWVIPKSMHGLCFALGSVTRKPWVVDGAVQARDILHLTVLFDHDTVDGIPAARFIARLVDRLERGPQSA